MTRTIRPIGKVSAALKRHGYRQQAVIIVDGEQLEHVAVLSRKVGDKIKFEGHYIDPNGELHKTGAFVDVKLAADRILLLRTTVLAPPAKPAAKEQRAARRAAKKPDTSKAASEKPAPRKRKDDAVVIDCKGCGVTHRNDDPCF